MDPFSSGDDMAIKSRKPYTISKQRERWTEEEHDRFLEAIKLYGRAWQRIEEHIGTKTAVQIRSHAQKFFLKLEKDASGKGVLISEVSDIDIPPPRPKKKPSNPYPRKNSAPSTTGPLEGKHGKASIAGSPDPIKELPEFQNGVAREMLNGNEKQETTCSAASLAATYTSMICEMPKTLNIQCTYEASASLAKELDHKNELPHEPNQPPEKACAELATMTSEKADLKNSQPTPNEAAEYVKKHAKFQNYYPLCSGEATLSECYKISAQTSDPVGAYPLYHNHLSNQPGEATTSPHDLMSSNTSATTDPQNPAAISAASGAAATLWTNMGAPAQYCLDFLPKGISSSEASPAIASIAAATVAAATAWWASNGLIPLCAPQQSVTVNQSCFTTNNDVPSYAAARIWNVTNMRMHMKPISQQDQQAVTDSPIFPGRKSAFKQLIMAAGKLEQNNFLLKSRQVLPTAGITGNKPTAVGAETQASNSPLEDRKKIDRSSSGSNTTSSTELAIDVLEKQDRGNEESNGPNDVQSVGDSSSRRSRITANTNESWKEVSQEGRVAFRALFSKQVLPQKFPSTQDQSTLDKLSTIDQSNEEKQGVLVSPIDLNSTLLETCCSDQVSDDNAMVGCEGIEMLNYTGLGNARTHKTAFKPYKGSFIEDTNASNTYSQGKEKRPKRICLAGGEASA